MKTYKDVETEVESATRIHEEGPVGEWVYKIFSFIEENLHVSAREGPSSGSSYKNVLKVTRKTASLC